MAAALGVAPGRERAVTVYVVAQLAFRRASWRCSVSSGGASWLPDEPVEVLEGAWRRDKVVLMSFPDEAAYRHFADPHAYQEISKDRRAGADAVVLLVKALAPAG
jgi:uncharacterized protein (DUF1330 family)